MVEGLDQGDFDDYSEALLQSEVYWNEGELLEYLKDPNSFIKGTVMPSLGISNEQTLTGIIEILKNY